MERGLDLYEHRFVDRMDLEWKLKLDCIHDTEDLEDCGAELLERRDRAIIAAAASVIFAVISLINYDFRRSPVIIFISVTCAAMSALGLHGVLTVRLYEVLVHLMITSALASVCCVCLVIESIFLQPGPDDPLAGAWWIMYVLLVPYAVILLCAIAPLLLAMSIINFKNLEEELSGLPTDDVIRQQVREVRDADLCCVCMVSRKDAACIPCGHKCMCKTCGSQLVVSGGRTCPICRKNITNIQQIFE